MEEKILNQQINEQVPVEPAKRSRNKVILSSISFILLLGLGAGFLLSHQNQSTSQKKQLAESELESKITSTPIPEQFRSLTVPYLRERSYASKLGEQEVISQDAEYISYLTNYDSDGLRVNGLLTRPTGDTPPGGWPAIVFIHGYIPPSDYQTTGQYADYVDYLARNGFVVFKIDLRGHGNSEGEAGGGYFGSDYIVDTLNARAALATTDFVNPDKIGLWGHSMAGNISMRAWAARPEIPAVVIWAGAVYTYGDREKYGINDSSFSPNSLNTQRQSRRRELFEKMGSPSAQSNFWQQVIPTNYANDLKGALQIHHAVDDDVVNVGYSRDLIKILENTSVPHALYEYPSGGHNISGASFETAIQRTVDFYKEYLQ